MKKSLVFFLLCVFAIGARAQQMQVSGKVTDEKGEVLIGATVSEIGTKNGTVTDFDGHFNVSVSKKNAQLVVSYLGFETKTVDVAGRIKLNVVLKTSKQTLQELVVVGYGTQKKASVTGAISSINQTLLKQTPTANISNALVGKVTGLTAIQASGEPGNDASTLYIRGKATFSGSTNPLVLVDGVERDFGNIDANEIESVSILKDASATAVYGVRGANGVILITTKRGEVGAPKVSFNNSYGIQEPTRLGEYCNSYQVLTLLEEGLANDGDGSQRSAATIAKYKDRSKPTYKYLYPDVNWTDALLRKSTPMMQSNINVSGGSDLFRYFISIGYMNQDGLYKYSDLKEYSTNARTQRYNFRSNIDVNIARDFKLMLNLGGIIEDDNYPGTSSSDLFTAIKQRLPYLYPMTNPDGSVAEIPNGDTNPYALLTQTGYHANKGNTLTATAGVTWDLSHLVTRGLSLTGRLSFDTYNYRNVARTKGYKAYQYSVDENATDLLNNGTYTTVRNGDETLGYSVSAGGTRYTLLELMMNYSHKFGKHDFGGLLMYNQSSKLADANNAVDGLPYRKQGIVGRITYNYNDKYFAEFNAGYNGSENFIKGKRMGFFPAISCGWIASEEQFMKFLKPLDLLKFRFSYGLVGNDDIGARFLYMSKWVTNWPGYAFGPTGNGLSLGGAGVSATGNKDLTWEKAKKLNLGMDVDLWNNLIHMTADVFFERRKDILCNPQTIPTTAGVYALPQINAGIVENKGFEIELEHRKTFRNWGYSIKGDFSYARNKIIDCDEPAKSDKPWQRQTGRRIDEAYGLKALGLFQTQDEVDKSPKMSVNNIQPGDIKYKDINGDGIINDDDYGYLGKTLTPDKILGLSLSGNWKGLDFSVLFQGALGGYTWFTGGACWPFESKCSVSTDVLNNYWSKNNTAAENLKVYYPRMVSDHSVNNYVNSTWWLKSSDYLRLKNAEIGYRLPKKILKHMGIESLRIYVNGSNLITWDHIKIFDPESPAGGITYPQMKVYNMGIDIQF
ncbi:MAG: TonB-dependent receptor [Prevotella sp.]|jgi:TonB-linked SusC/RagA family outer membrane protein|nr:TonB-dependent receptor [Prevotella sp.]MCH4099599.1 TonB-dependent receptor [Prevotella sp.]MCI1473133.1 TonB-dependent receptor [Prevotella sp.]MCI1549430.1 TonB-dependent receptor [Prevotella sp.]MCI1596005.1 TonB-dependent receptor [Prevotella sp.]